MLTSRLTLGTLIIAVLAGLCWLDWHASRPGIWLFAVACIVAGLAAMEAAALAPPPHGRAATARIVLGTLLLVALSGVPLIWPATPEIGPIGWPAVGLAAGLLVPIVGAVLAYRGPGQARVGMAFSVFAITYVGLPLSFFIYLRMLGDSRLGMVALVSVIVTVKMGDIGAYAVGRAAGRHKMAPALSPGKTWEGAAGGAVLACVGAWLTLVPLARSMGLPVPATLTWVVYGLLLNTAGVLGDLAESLLKRDAGVKDSSQYLPGFGGVLDLLDSLLLAAPIGYVLWQLAIHAT
jgi:phosphatidate cytidylyltransferase